MRKRGANENEVVETIRLAEWREARSGRFEAKQDFQYNAEWNKKFYKIKQVNPVFVVERDTIVVITVYALYIA
ncbi:hypothetical protein HYW17_00715 [Candidatus Uhrbacteria bacterium]|nr:hypothetical protein [Candidatus Uhrbacteria bacterium]